MASAPLPTDPARLPWAKVAASTGKENMSFAVAAASNSVKAINKESARGDTKQQDRRATIKAIPKALASTTDHSTTSMTGIGPSKDGSSAVQTAPAKEVDTSLTQSITALNIQEPMPSLVVDGSGLASSAQPSESAENFSEDQFARAESESGLGTKPPSLDGKSITSGTTFALDEKESLRPDDSASVMAAEDDDTFSGRGSIVAGSRMGSEAAARAYRAYEAGERRSMQPMLERQTPGIVTPQSGSSSQQLMDEAKSQPLAGPAGMPDGFNLFYRQTPDEKLLEALESPKDRIFLLRLEQDLIEFVKDSKEPFIDLPPCNSFCRMLTHKLADYYHMTHQFDAETGSVRIFRTPFCRLPPSLTIISSPPTTGSTPPPMQQPMMKIMRRGGDGDTGPSPSKTTSETGSDGKDKALSAKEKLSREEREAAYLKARERIFGQKDEKTGDATPETEDGNEMSRSSSISNKDKTGQAKRGKPAKQRRDDSDSFDSRSQYTPWFPSHQTPTWVPSPQYPQMVPQMVPQQFNGQNAYNIQVPQQFGPPNMQFNQGMMSSGSMPNYNGMQQVSHPQFPQQNQRAPSYSAPMTAYGSPVPSPSVAQQQWPQNNMYQVPYQQQQPQPSQPAQQNRVVSVPGSSSSGSSVPYQYGQLPNSNNPADPKSQHPIPGSFNRHAFNPKTQSFVPGNTSLPVPQTMSHYSSPHMSYNNSYTPPHQQQQFNNGAGCSMVRQGSNNSIPSYHASPHMGHRTMMPQGMQQGMPQGLGHGLSSGMSMPMSQGMPISQVMSQQMPPGMNQGPPQGMQSMGHSNQGGGGLPNYGNPATLPPKPPTGV
ncbi:hypothetical protein BJ878DRAFT_417279 [Calycina marina]|uniref:R3H domain-containing protein n=1 Tax=Calycina marina TaxID=1763456 RepID=A0A9P7Z707_9HELO|nr:hypothetical protein BJ878DRAFT_417279 [Calycina marina]